MNVRSVEQRRFSHLEFCERVFGCFGCIGLECGWFSVDCYFAYAQIHTPDV